MHRPSAAKLGAQLVQHRLAHHVVVFHKQEPQGVPVANQAFSALIAE